MKGLIVGMILFGLIVAGFVTSTYAGDGGWYIIGFDAQGSPLEIGPFLTYEACQANKDQRNGDGSQLTCSYQERHGRRSDR